MNTRTSKKGLSKWLSRPYILSERPEILLASFTLGILLITLVIAYNINTLEGIGECFSPSKDAQNFIVESLKILGAAIYAGFVALLVTNVWQQKSIGFEMLKELNSQEFFEVRNILSTQKKIALKEEIDIDDISHWFPGGRYDINKEIVLYTKEEFTRAHALPSMIYFVVRLSNYARHGMLNIRATKNLFNVFFVHYRILILEFASAFERYYYDTYLNDYQSYTEIKNQMWLRRVEDLRFFFDVIGLDSELPNHQGYKYEYFPSLNKNYKSSSMYKCASEIDLEDYIAKQRDLPTEASSSGNAAKKYVLRFLNCLRIK